MEKLNTGEVEDLKKVALEDIKKFKKDHYTASNSILAITGDINENELENILNKYLSKLPKGTKIKEPVITASNKSNKEIIKSNYNQKHIKIDYNGFKLKDKKRYALTLLAFFIDTYLNRVLKQEKGLAYVISAKDFYSNSFGVFSIYTATDNLNIIDEINKELSNIKNNLNNLTNEEIEIAKRNIISDLVFSLENSSQMLDFYATNYLFKNTLTLQREIENYKQVSKDDIVKVFNYIVTQEQKVTILE